MAGLTIRLPLTTRHYLAMFPPEVIVRIDSIDGPSFFWVPELEEDELEVWWKSRDSFDEPEPAPNKASLHYEDARLAHLSAVLPGRVLPLESYEDVELGSAISREGCTHYCRICCERDAFLVTPKGTFLYHKGYTGPPRNSLECI